MSRITHDLCMAFPLAQPDSQPRNPGPTVLLRRHPFPVTSFFRHSLVLTYAFPEEVLQPLLPPGLVLDTFGRFGFVAIAMVQTEGLRPVGFPRVFGQDFFLTGYRIFARYKTQAGRTLRGLRILRSDTDKGRMAFFGNRLTHYNYHRAEVEFDECDARLEVKVRTPEDAANLHVIADLKSQPAPLPEGSPFKDLREARLFAGPLPFTFDYEKETHSIVMIEGVREDWKPTPIKVEVLQNTFFDHAPFAGAGMVLANAFHVERIPYRWKRGVVEQLPMR
jgi:hypothetical protein